MMTQNIIIRKTKKKKQQNKTDHLLTNIKYFAGDTKVYMYICNICCTLFLHCSNKIHSIVFSGRNLLTVSDPENFQKCPTQRSLSSRGQGATGPMSKQDSGALGCAPSSVTVPSVGAIHYYYYTHKHIYIYTYIDINCSCLCSGLLGFMCPLALSCYTAHKYGEHCCLGCMLGGMTAMRTHMRLTYGIQVCPTYQLYIDCF